MNEFISAYHDLLSETKKRARSAWGEDRGRDGVPLGRVGRGHEGKLGIYVL